MLLNTTHTDKKNTELINDCLGLPFPLFKSLQLGGVGSKRMIIDDVSQGFKKLLNSASDLNYGNIELRPSGIIVHINKGLQNFSWIIPHHKLAIYKSDGLSIHSQGKFVRFKDNKLLKENKKFINKMLKMKAENTIKTDFREQA